ncbi:MAG: hypothetical protein IJG33_13375 [Selenomonadaceae bacterium]|nr:hypothetical protein [Selenomonadaceae bacterium]
METIIIENRDEEKSITHPQFGQIRYFVIKGKPWMVRADVSRAFGLKDGSGHRISIIEQSLRAVTTYRKATNPVWILINDEGLKFYSVDGKKNLERRVKNWLLKNLYGEQIDESEPTLFMDSPLMTPAPVTLSPAQMQELVRRVAGMLKAEPLEISLPAEEQEKFVDDVAAKFQNRPINLTDKQMDDIAFKVLALIEDMKPNEDALAERVLEKFLGKIAQKK